MHRAAVLALGLAVSGCALKSDVRRVEAQLAEIRAEAVRADEARAAALEDVRAQLAEADRQLSEALVAQAGVLTLFRAETGQELLEIQQQLVQIQELTGQSQQRLSELRSQLERRTDVLPPDTGAAAGQPGALVIFEASNQQLRRGAVGTAREGFRQFLALYPTNDRAPDALYFIGESFEREEPDSAAAVYEEVVTSYPSSPRAPQALYKLGLLTEQRGQGAAARRYYERVLRDYPRSPEASLAREKLQGGAEP